MITVGQTRPSYDNGFARRDGPPDTPSDWDGLIGLWAPLLGITGDNLHDNSGFARRGVLTNTPTWVQREVGPALRFDAANERVVATTTHIPITTGLTVLQYSRRIGGAPDYASYGPDTATGFRSFGGASNPAEWNVRVEISAGSNIGRTTPGIIVLNQWHTHIFTVEPAPSANSDLKLYVDGVQVDSGDNAGNPFQAGGVLWIGSTFGGFVGDQETALFAVWDHVLKGNKIHELGLDPQRILRQADQHLALTPAAPAAGGRKNPLNMPLTFPIGGPL